jgi:flavin reductase (DIM6/NTAB) family NADH-FMN oxidoreductase RutF
VFAFGQLLQYNTGSKEASSMKVIKPATTALFPVPAVMVTCGLERPNIITLAWVGTVCSDPPAVGIGVRPERFSHGLLVAGGEFVVNLPRVDQLPALDYCGQVSGRSVDKWTACGLTPAPASKVRVPLIAECPIALECRVVQRVPLGSHDLFIGQVLAIQASEEVLDEQGRLDYERAQMLTYMGGHYYDLGKRLGRYGDWRAGIG